MSAIMSGMPFRMDKVHYLTPENAIASIAIFITIIIGNKRSTWSTHSGIYQRCDTMMDWNTDYRELPVNIAETVQESLS